MHIKTLLLITPLVQGLEERRSKGRRLPREPRCSHRAVARTSLLRKRAPHSAARVLRAARRIASVAVASAPAPRVSALLIRYVCANVSPFVSGVEPVTRDSVQPHPPCIAAVTSLRHFDSGASVGLTTTEYPLTYSDDVYDAEHAKLADFVVPVKRNAPAFRWVYMWWWERTGAGERVHGSLARAAANG